MGFDSAITDLRALAPRAGLQLPDPMVRDVVDGYGRPTRAYHSFDHVLEVLSHWRAADDEVPWNRPAETFLAVLYHDVVYEPGRVDNEVRSARWAERACKAWLPPSTVDIERVVALIELTAQHGKLRAGDVDAEAARFLDCDMAILGAGRQRFGEYERQIADEYAHLPPEAFAEGRRRFVEKLLAMPTIYLSDYGARFEAAARRNLAAFLD